MYVYITTNLVNGKKYIGVSVRKDNKYRETYLGSGVRLKKAIEKYGIENFKKEIIKEFSTAKEARDYERQYIEECNAIKDPNYYNLVAGGYGGAVIGHAVSEETRKKIGLAHKGKHWLTKEQLIEKGLRARGKKQTKEAVENRRASLKERWALYTSEEKEERCKKLRKKQSVVRAESQKLQISQTLSHLSKEQVLDLVERREVVGETYSSLSKRFNLSASCLVEIIQRKTYKWVWE